MGQRYDLDSIEYTATNEEISKMRFCALLCFVVATLFAQSNQATVNGVVTDAQSAMIPGATVTATNTATGVHTMATTNETGFYAIPNLAPGVYTLAVERSGFRRYVRKDIILNTGQTLGLDVRMELGAVTETVNVASEAPLIETRTSDVNHLIESKSVENLPLGNRRTLNVVRMTGAALFVEYPNNPGNANPQFSLAGGRAQSQMAWIDGGAAQNMRLGVGQINLDPPVEVVEEIKVLTNSYSAEYGGSAGGVIVETTKSGTNHLHGSLYEYLRNDALDAPGFFAAVQNGAKVKPKLRYNVFGGTVGGPIRRDRTFFFFGYEGQRLRTGGVETLTVPSGLQRAGDFSQTFNQAGRVIPIYDPATTQSSGNTFVRNPFPDNRIPVNRLDPVALNLMKFYPLPNRPPDNITGANNFRANYVSAFVANFYMVKIDHNLSDHDRLTGRYLFNGGPGTNTSVFPDPGADSRAHAENRQQYWHGAWTRTITPAVVSDFRFTYINRVFHNLTNGLGGNYPDKLGLKGVPNNAFPQFAPAGFTALGSNAQERRQFPIEQRQFVENVAWTRGRHALKFGFEARRSRNHEVNLSTASGAFGFSTQPTALPGNAATGNGLASLLVGFPTSFNESQTQVLDRSSWYLAAFAQDDWTISPSLTINLGLRFETDTPIVDANNRMNGFDNTQINPVSGTPGVVKFMGVNGFRTSPYSTDWNNFGPRLGFAWRPLGSTHTVVRGGYGVFFAHPLDSGQPTAASLGFSVSAALNSPDNGITAPFYLRDGVPGVTVAAPVLDDSFGAVKMGQNANTSISYFETNRRTGYSEQFNLGVQRELPGSSVIEATVLGNFSRKLASTNLSTNQILPALLGPDHQSQKDRPFPQFSDVLVIAPPLGVSNYYGVLLRFQKRYSHGLNMGVHFTFSRFLENTNDSGTTLGNNGGPYSNYYNRRADYGPAANDVRRHFGFNAVYQLPFGAGRRWLGKNPLRYVAGGWSVANLTNVQSGPPFTVTTQTNTTNAFSAGALRANVLRDPNLPADRRAVAQWFDTSAFAQPAAYQFGNEGVGILRAAGVVNLDFSLLRDFRLTERAQMQFRGEFFNAFNHTNLGLPGRAFGGPGFGVISSSGPARQIQVGARISF